MSNKLYMLFDHFNVLNTWLQLPSKMEYRHINTNKGYVQNYICFLKVLIVCLFSELV